MDCDRFTRLSLVEIDPARDGVLIDLAYATADNVTGQPIYRNPVCCLRREAHDALMRAAALARPIGYGILVFDAFRPQKAQEILWAFNPDPLQVADPATGSNHTRGVAVDLTLIETATGRPLDMGTGFDAFCKESYHASTAVPAEAQANRFLLLGLMTAAGWTHIESEWWHYQLPGTGWPLLSDDSAPAPMM